MIETARLVRKLSPFDDGSGHRYVVTVSRNRKTHDSDAEVTVSIESGDNVVTINASDWTTVRDAIGNSVDFVCECPE
jgi:hypothetical protein